MKQMLRFAITGLILVTLAAPAFADSVPPENQTSPTNSSEATTPPEPGTLGVLLADLLVWIRKPIN